MPLASILIPSYNGAAFLGETLEAALAQTYPNLEVLVVDDGSTDDTRAVLERYAGRIRWLRQDNGGLSSARNAAQRAARGEYLAWIDADDLCAPDRIAMQVACLEAFADIDLCCSGFAAFNEHGVVSESYASTYYASLGRAAYGPRDLFDDQRMLDLAGRPGIVGGGTASIPVLTGQVYERLVWGNFIHPPTVMVRRSHAEQVGEYSTELRLAGDYDWLLRASQRGRVAYIDRPLIRYRLSSNQMSADRGVAGIKLDVVRIMERVRDRDPELWRARQDEFRRRIGDSYLGAADVQADNTKAAALVNVAKSIAHRGVDGKTLKTVIKVALPAVALRWLRRTRRPSAGRPW